jgi:hypothetical protein
MENDKSKSTERVVYDAAIKEVFKEYYQQWRSETQYLYIIILFIPREPFGGLTFGLRYFFS